MNKAIKFPQGLPNPWRVRVYTEIFERAHWLKQGINHFFADACIEFKNPLFPGYPMTKSVPDCPAPKNVSNFDNLNFS